MLEGRIIRDGELTQQSLADAVLDERGAGRSPAQLVVGSAALELRALQVLATNGGGSPLDALRSTVPNIVLDPSMPDDAWELRAS